MTDPNGSPLNSLARDLATGDLTRRAALGRLAGAGLVAALPAWLIGTSDDAEAGCPPRRRCNGKCCPPNSRCREGRCKCISGYRKCGTRRCHNLQTSELHCGACGVQCGANETCVNGACTGGGAVCGNGVIEAGEDCDGDNLGGATCESLGNGSGVLFCASNCTYDTSECETPGPPTCSDNFKNGDETDIDCGGSSCQPCANGLNCILNADCESGVCCTGICSAQCG